MQAVDSWKVARIAFGKMKFTGVLIHKTPVDTVFCSTCLLPLVFLNVVLDLQVAGAMGKFSKLGFFCDVSAK